MSDDDGQRAAVRRARREQRIQRRDELALLAKIMAEPAGRRWFYNLLAMCHVYATSFATNALSMAFAEGERNIGIRIGADLTEASPDLYLQMLKEANNERLRSNGSDTDDDSGDQNGGTD